ncbi:MAG TPA: hypothetical protein VEZ70_14225 [Allosphingosinicella sp.]|nr:hypothetical protein [Allosphingosinicella sp.]
MRKFSILTAAAAGAVAVAACGGGDSNTPTAEEAAELNNAAAMLEAEDASPDSLTVEEAPIGNGDAPASTGDVLVGGGENAATNGAAPVGQ